jgi:hypothetical protein
MRNSIALFLFVFFCFFSCKKEEAPPSNPYENVNYNNGTNEDPSLDPNSIQGLHKNILFPRCANPGCHDGTFEPDYRTVESSYSTLVYQPVNMVTLDSAQLFSYRVIPHNTGDSWLIERLTTTTSDYMPSNSTRLSQTEIDHFKTWINNGCPDINGNLPQKPDLQPNVVGYVSFDSLFQRLDTVRLDNIIINPFIVRQGSNMTIAFVALDTADGSSSVDPGLFTLKQIQCTTVKDDYSNAQTFNANFYYTQGNAWFVPVNTSAWSTGTTVYFRVVINDGNHSSNSIFPRYESIDYYKTLYAFYIQ